MISILSFALSGLDRAYNWLDRRRGVATTLFAFTFGVCVLALFPVACATTSSPGIPTSTQQTIANAVEDAISIGLVPVLTKNPTYAGAAQTVALGLGSFSGSTITPADVDALLSKVPQLSAADRATVAGIVNAAWGVYSKRYAQAVGASVRPDVKLFLAAVANGISSAIAAVPSGPTAFEDFMREMRDPAPEIVVPPVQRTASGDFGEFAFVRPAVDRSF